MIPTIQEIQAVDWRRGYDWSVRLAGVDPPFDRWFPATDVRENEYSLEAFDFGAGQSTFKLPETTTLFDVVITFVEDVRRAVSLMLNQWVNRDILHNGEYVEYLVNCLRLLEIYKLNSAKEPIALSQYKVFPNGQGYFTGTSEGTQAPGEATFIVAETLQQNVPLI